MGEHQPDIDFETLAIFAAVAETGSFTKGAARAFRSQPVASARIGRLERELGCPLLERSGRAVRLTREGEALHDYAKRILALRREAVEALSRRRGDLSGDLAIGASTIPATYLVPRWAAAFHRRHPAVRIRVGVASTAEVARRVADGECDLGFVGDRPRGADLHAVPVGSDEIVAALPERHRLARRSAPLAPADLRGERVVGRTAGSGTRSVLERALKRAGLDPARDFDVVCEVDSTEAAREAASAGVGIAFLSSLAVAGDAACRRLAVRRLAGSGLRRPFWLVTPRTRRLSRAARAFADLVRR